MLQDVSFKLMEALKSLGPCCKNKIECCYVTPKLFKASSASFESKKKKRNGEDLNLENPSTIKGVQKNPNKQQDAKLQAKQIKPTP